MASAKFVGIDFSTQGTWLPCRGRLGYFKVEGAASLAASALPTGVAAASEAPSFSWASATDDPRALQRLDGSTRDADTWYGDPGFTVALSGPLGACRLRVYCLDFTGGPRGQSVALSDPATGSVLDSRTLDPGTYVGGAWLTWDVAGPVVVTFTKLSGANAVCAGIFIDPAPPGRRATLAAALGPGNGGGEIVGAGAGTLGRVTSAGSGESRITSALSIDSPSRAAPGASGVAVALRGVGTSWSTSSPTFAVDAGTIAGQSIASDTAATITLDAPATAGTVTITDPSTGATAQLPIYLAGAGTYRERWFPGLARRGARR